MWQVFTRCLAPVNEVWGKVMFLPLSVSSRGGDLPTGVYLRRGSLPRGSLHPGGISLGVSLWGDLPPVWGVCIGGGEVCQGGLPTEGQSLPREGVCLRGVCIQGGFCILGDGQTPRTRKAGGTHPTGPLSCSSCTCRQILIVSVKVNGKRFGLIITVTERVNDTYLSFGVEFCSFLLSQ